MKMWDWVKGLVVVCIVIGVTAGCSSGSASKSSAGSAEANMASNAEAAADTALTAEAPAEAEMPASEESGVGSQPSVGSSYVPASGEQPQTNRMLIYTANITMEVESYGDAYTEIQNLIHLSEGYILGFTEETTSFEKTGFFTIKVPAGGFNGFLSKLESIPNVQMNRSLKAQDVSEEYVDLEARLKAKQVVERRLLDFMEKATRTDDLVAFSNELARVQEEIERMKGRMRYLEQNVAFSTVELRVYEKLDAGNSALGEKQGGTLGERMRKAVESSLDVLVIVFEGVLVLIAGLIPVAAAAAVIGIPAIWLWKRRGNRSNKQETPPNDL